MSFKDEAKKATDRIPTHTIVLEPGEFISGKVMKIGRYLSNWGPVPVITYDPADQETDRKTDYDGVELKAKGNDAFVIFAMGAALTDLANVLPGDMLYVRHDGEVEGKNGTYQSYTKAVKRNGGPVISPELLPPIGGATVDTIANVIVQDSNHNPDEEPFG